ncbi:unnamed protein product [Paramecium primaurelia]|uniref:Uncharacterized protein n=1 Tax=Paramecium primaurelia TaxID=5886 RepID=A0A8S1L4I5_PARPR|nr:unnamed protein product [Paramecium primaurelia]
MNTQRKLGLQTVEIHMIQGFIVKKYLQCVIQPCVKLISVFKQKIVFLVCHQVQRRQIIQLGRVANSQLID